jgi:phosphonate transport system substrate-binding protein
MPPLRVGAVMYDPKVSAIWEVIRDFFESRGCPIDVSFFSTYELQVTALLDRALDIAWEFAIGVARRPTTIGRNVPCHRDA